jgi:phage gp29-like protein
MKFLDKIKNLTSKGEQMNLNVVSNMETKPVFANTSITADQVYTAILYKERNGSLQKLNILYNKLWEADANLAACIDTRTEALKSKQPVLQTELSQQQTEYLLQVQREFYPMLVDAIIEYKLKGYMFKQIEYEQRQDGFIYPTSLLSYKYADLRASNNKLVLYHNDKPKSLADFKFFAFLNNRSILQPLLKYYIFKSFAINNWASFTEIFGKPMRIGKYKPGATKTEKDQLWEMLQNAGTDLAAMISENVVMDFVDNQNKAASSNLYNDLLKFCEDTTTKRILGQTLTSNAEKTGSFAQAKEHDMVRRDILSGDARDLTLLINHFYSNLMQINFGNYKVATTIDVSPEIDLLERVQIDRTLANEIGIEFPEDYWHKTYKVPDPREQ